MQPTIETVTPEIAFDWLDRNTRNRPLSKPRVKNLASSMQRGEWELTGDAIRFAESGALLDGQHRLAAIVESGVSIETMVVSNLPDRIFDVIDRGAPRTAGNVFALRGEKNYNALAAVARMVYLWQLKGNPFGATSEDNPTARQLEETIDCYPGIRETTNSVIGLPWTKKYMTSRIAGFCLYVFGQSPFAESLDGFVDTLEHGVASARDNPAIALRNRLMEDRGAKIQMGSYYKTALIFKAFTKYANGESTKFLRVRTEGNQAEKDLFATPGANNRSG